MSIQKGGFFCYPWDRRMRFKHHLNRPCGLIPVHTFIQRGADSLTPRKRAKGVDRYTGVWYNTHIEDWLTLVVFLVRSRKAWRQACTRGLYKTNPERGKGHQCSRFKRHWLVGAMIPSGLRQKKAKKAAIGPDAKNVLIRGNGERKPRKGNWW